MGRRQVCSRRQRPGGAPSRGSSRLFHLQFPPTCPRGLRSVCGIHHRQEGARGRTPRGRDAGGRTQLDPVRLKHEDPAPEARTWRAVGRDSRSPPLRGHARQVHAPGVPPRRPLPADRRARHCGSCGPRGRGAQRGQHRLGGARGSGRAAAAGAAGGGRVPGAVASPGSPQPPAQVSGVSGAAGLRRAMLWAPAPASQAGPGPAVA